MEAARASPVEYVGFAVRPTRGDKIAAIPRWCDEKLACVRRLCDSHSIYSVQPLGGTYRASARLRCHVAVAKAFVRVLRIAGFCQFGRFLAGSIGKPCKKIVNGFFYLPPHIVVCGYTRRQSTELSADQTDPHIDEMHDFG